MPELSLAQSKVLHLLADAWALDATNPGSGVSWLKERAQETGQRITERTLDTLVKRGFIYADPLGLFYTLAFVGAEAIEREEVLPMQDAYKDYRRNAQNGGYTPISYEDWFSIQPESMAARAKFKVGDKVRLRGDKNLETPGLNEARDAREVLTIASIILADTLEIRGSFNTLPELANCRVAVDETALEPVPMDVAPDDYDWDLLAHFAVADVGWRSNDLVDDNGKRLELAGYLEVAERFATMTEYRITDTGRAALADHLAKQSTDIPVVGAVDAYLNAETRWHTPEAAEQAAYPFFEQHYDTQFKPIDPAVLAGDMQMAGLAEEGMKPIDPAILAGDMNGFEYSDVDVLPVPTEIELLKQRIAELEREKEVQGNWLRLEMQAEQAKAIEAAPSEFEKAWKAWEANPVAIENISMAIIASLRNELNDSQAERDVAREQLAAKTAKLAVIQSALSDARELDVYGISLGGLNTTYEEDIHNLAARRDALKAQLAIFASADATNFIIVLDGAETHVRNAKNLVEVGADTDVRLAELESVKRERNALIDERNELKAQVDRLNRSRANDDGYALFLEHKYAGGGQ